MAEMAGKTARMMTKRPGSKMLIWARTPNPLMRKKMILSLLSKRKKATMSPVSWTAVPQAEKRVKKKFNSFFFLGASFT